MSTDRPVKIAGGASGGMAAWLATRSPAEVDQAAVLHAAKHGLSVVFLSPGGFPFGLDANREFLDTCSVDGVADFAAVADELRKLLSPAPEVAIEEWVAELSVITARRPADEFEERLRLRAYASRLRRYPADVAKHVLLEHPWRFWPSWAEVKEQCDDLVKPRRLMIGALEREAGASEPVADEYPWLDRHAQADQQMREEAHREQREQIAKILGRHDEGRS